MKKYLYSTKKYIYSTKNIYIQPKYMVNEIKIYGQPNYFPYCIYLVCNLYEIPNVNLKRNKKDNVQKLINWLL